MTYSSRGLREAVVRALAKVGLVWVLAVLAALFMAMSAQGQHRDGGYSLAGATQNGAPTAAFSVTTLDAPSTPGLAVALTILIGGMTVLAIGCLRGEGRPAPVRADQDRDQPGSDLPLTMALGLLP